MYSSPFLLSVLALSIAFAPLAIAADAAAGVQLTVYTALEDDELVVYRKLWQAEHPEITLDVVRDSTGVVTARLLAEAANPQADVVWGLAASSLLLADQRSLLAAYSPAGVERIKNGFKDMANTVPHWVGIKAWETGFVCNTVELKRLGVSAPASYEDLLKPEFRGQLAMPNPASSGTGFLTVSAILQLKGEAAGWAYLDKLHANIARYTHSGSAPAKLAGKGEVVVGISFGYRGVKQKKAGEPVTTRFPSEGSGWDLEANALIAKSQVKPAARVFLDWAISSRLMQEYAKGYPIVAIDMPVNVPDEDYPADPMRQLIRNDFAWAAANRERILAEWSRRYDGKSDRK